MKTVLSVVENNGDLGEVCSLAYPLPSLPAPSALIPCPHLSHLGPSLGMFRYMLLFAKLNTCFKPVTIEIPVVKCI